MVKVISILNQKGGTGKTTTTVSLGHCLAQKGHQVLVVDLDPQANTTVSFDIYPKDFNASTAIALIDEEVSLSSIVIPTRIKGLYLAPADSSLGSVDINLANLQDKQFKLKKKIEKLNFKYDFILIDCPPSLGLLPINALVASNYVLIPMLAKYLALEGLKHMNISIEKVKQELNPEIEMMGILFCMVDFRLRITKASIALVKENFGDKVMDKHVRLCSKFDEAVIAKKTIFEYAPKSNGAIDYQEATECILDKITAKGQIPRSRMLTIFDRLVYFLNPK